MSEFPKGKPDGIYENWDAEGQRLEIEQHGRISPDVADIVVKGYGGRFSIEGTETDTPRFSTRLTVKGETEQDARIALSSRRGGLNIEAPNSRTLSIDGSSEDDTDERIIDPEERGVLPPHELVPDTGIRRQVHLSLPEGQDARFLLDMKVADTTISGTKGASYEIDSKFGNVDLTDTEGDVRVSTYGGDVKGENVQGKIKIDSIGGDIDFDGIKGEVQFHTDAGDVSVRDATLVGENNVISSFSGTVDVEVVNDMDVHAIGPHGRISLPPPEEGFTQTSTESFLVKGRELRRSVDGYTGLGYSSDRLEIKSGEDVTLHIAQEPPENV